MEFHRSLRSLTDSSLFSCSCSFFLRYPTIQVNLLLNVGYKVSLIFCLNIGDDLNITWLNISLITFWCLDIVYLKTIFWTVCFLCLFLLNKVVGHMELAGWN